MRGRIVFVSPTLAQQTAASFESPLGFGQTIGPLQRENTILQAGRALHGAHTAVDHSPFQRTILRFCVFIVYSFRSPICINQHAYVKGSWLTYTRARIWQECQGWVCISWAAAFFSFLAKFFTCKIGRFGISGASCTEPPPDEHFASFIDLYIYWRDIYI